MKSLFSFALLAAFAALGAPSRAQMPEKLPTAPAYAIGTFESLGLYFNSPDLGECKVRFKVRGAAPTAANWREGLPLWFDARAGQYRGSLVHLAPGTSYDVELTAGAKTVALSGQTRSETFPVGKITTLPAGDSETELKITQSGTPNAYHVVTFPAGGRSLIDVRNRAETNITIDADYVIVRGLDLRGAAKHGILIKGGRHDIVVEDCRVSTWGRIGGPESFGNEGSRDSAVFAEDGTRNLVVQRCLLENPRGAANDWATGHPLGPAGITVDRSQGGNILRYNTIRSSEDHGFDDGISGAQNFSTVGNMNRDSDVYGNLIRNVWDDGLEIEGANCNVRIWGNYITQTTQGIATAATSIGPVYIFRNVFGESRWGHDNPTGGYVLKTGGGPEDMDRGRRFVFHNTVLQPRGASHVFSGASDPNAMSRNNVWRVPGMLVRNRTPEQVKNSDFAFDIYTGLGANLPDIANRVRTPIAFADSNALEFFPRVWADELTNGRSVTDPDGKRRRIPARIAPVRNRMVDGGTRLPNFNDDFAGTAPDIGAFERGRAPLKFGRAGQNPPPAPWE